MVTIDTFKQRALEYSGLGPEEIVLYLGKIKELEARIVDEAQITENEEQVVKARKVHDWLMALNPDRGNTQREAFDYYRLDKVIDGDLERRTEAIGRCAILTAEYVIITYDLGLDTVPLGLNGRNIQHSLTGLKHNKGYILIDNVVPKGFGARYKPEALQCIRRRGFNGMLADILSAKSSAMNLEGETEESVRVLRQAIKISPDAYLYSNLGNRYLKLYETADNQDRVLQMAFNAYKSSRDIRVGKGLPVIETVEVMLKVMKEAYPHLM
ncbi:MAG: tetratricopeptide repeat protein [Nanoarchaeota archaeon]|nr:tetratricopeptide repeat protein [Nanoarchaeota archaeon]